MDRKIKVVQYGVGKMSLYTMRYAIEKGCELVGAIDINPELTGILISSVDDAEDLLKAKKPDICIVTTMSLFNDVYEALELCARLGVNAITTCEEAFFPINSNPISTKAIDALAKGTNCTITGSGYQDVYWGELISAIASSTQRVTKISGSSSYNVEDYGIALAEAHGAGLTLEEFEDKIASADKMTEEERQKQMDACSFLPSYMWNVNGWLAEKLGLHITSQTQKCIPTTYEEEINSNTLNMVIEPGKATGMSAIVTSETEEGVIIEAECVGKVYSPDDFDKNEWTVYGEPDTTITVARPRTVELTCATIVNRIPDVINAKPGFVPTCEIGEPTYKFKPLNEYVNE